MKEFDAFGMKPGDEVYSDSLFHFIRRGSVKLKIEKRICNENKLLFYIVQNKYIDNPEPEAMRICHPESLWIDEKTALSYAHSEALGLVKKIFRQYRAITGAANEAK